VTMEKLDWRSGEGGPKSIEPKKKKPDVKNGGESVTIAQMAGGGGRRANIERTLRGLGAGGLSGGRFFPLPQAKIIEFTGKGPKGRACGRKRGRVFSKGTLPKRSR